MSFSHTIRPKKGKDCGCSAPKPTMTANRAEESEERAVPAVDIIEGPNEFILVADLPGAEEDSIDVEVNGGELTISAETIDEAPDAEEEEVEEEEVVCRCRRFEPGNFFRSFRIAESIDADRISADYRNGVLTVKLPKKAELEPRKISVGNKKPE